MSVPPTDDVPPTNAEPLVGPASETAWREERLRFRPLHMVRTWLFSAIGLLVAAWIVPGAHINGFWAALLVAAVIAALNAILPPFIAAIRLPLTLVFGWSGGSKLVKDSYTDAKGKASEMKASRGKGLDALEGEEDAQAADADA